MYIMIRKARKPTDLFLRLLKIRTQLHTVKIKWEFVQPFPVFRRIFLNAIMDKLAESGMKSIRNTTTERKIPRKTENSSRNSHLILSFFMQPGPGLKFGQSLENRMAQPTPKIAKKLRITKIMILE